MRKALLLILIAAVGLSVLAGCAKPPVPGPTENPDPIKPVKDTLIMELKSDISTFDPQYNVATISKVVYMNIFEPLMDYHEGDYVPRLAKSYKVSDDGLTYTFSLKQGVKFHNGQEFNSEDVVATIERAKKSSYMTVQTADIDEVVAIDPYTVSIKLKREYIPFLINIALEFPMLNKEAIDQYGEALKSNPIGTGPYKLRSRMDGEYVILDRFDDWHEGSVPIKEATFKIISEATSAVIALETGDLDLVNSTPPIARQSIRDNQKLTLAEVRTLTTQYLPMNLTKAPFDDINFRMAINYAIDRQKIIDVAYEGGGVISTTVWGPTTVGYSPNITSFEYNPVKAKEYLAKSSYDGRTIEYSIGYEGARKQAVLIQEDLRAVGITMNIALYEQNSWIQDMRSGNYDISSINMTVTPDVHFWTRAFHSSSIGTVLNFSRLNNPLIDESFDKGLSIQDPANRIKNYEIIGNYIKDQAVVVPICYIIATPAFSADLTISQYMTDGYPLLRYMAWK